ncbi:MAG: disulfide bond formation protein B [Rhodosalinus sp.]|uniref:disulfide bond formation protein B n=1 Tax=Rhodosalinus sp. TaxID=2047741 RepID=UPI00397A9EEB
MTRNGLILIAAGGSAAMLAMAFAFQHLGGLAPCALCLWQRWPHAAAVVIGVLGLALPGAALPLFGAVAAGASGGIGGYHLGVEQGWWEGPATCSGGSEVGELSVEELTAQIMAAPVVRCDEVAWSLAGLSMAGWNAVLSLALMAIWLVAALRAYRV